MKVVVGSFVTFWYDKCEYLGRVASIKGTEATVEVVVADIDFLSKFGRNIKLHVPSSRISWTETLGF